MTIYEKCGGALWERKKKLHSRCIRCGRRLKDTVSQERGYGEVCWEKHLADNQSKLF